MRLSGARDGYVIKAFPSDRARIDIGSYHAEDAAFRETTGWTPRVSLEEGLQRSLDWYRQRLPSYV